jgi:hypothetical protein
MMKSFSELDIVVDKILVNRLPTEYVFEMDSQEFEETQAWFDSIINGNILRAAIPHKGRTANCHLLKYAGINFLFLEKGTTNNDQL